MAARSRLYVKARLVVPVGKRRRAFVKVYDSSRRDQKRRLRRLLERERVCLHVLEGLAVPKLLPLPDGVLEEHLGFKPDVAVAQSFVSGKPLHKADLTPRELLGSWLFLTEQLVAFRRHQILYTDLKPSNVVVRKRPLKVMQIDFDRAVAASEDGVYTGDVFGYTAGYQAPEMGQNAQLRETSVVFQLGMLLASSWMGLDNCTIRDPDAGLDSLCERVARVGNRALADTVGACLAYAPEKRPSGYEEVLERIKNAIGEPKSRAVVSVWESLRRPYVDRLGEVELVL